MINTRKNLGFTIMELMVTIGIMVIISIFIHQIFFSTSDAVKLGIAVSNSMNKGAAIQNQLTYDTDSDLMLGPARVLGHQVIGFFEAQARCIDVLDDAIVQLAPDPLPVGGQDLGLFHFRQAAVHFYLEYFEGADDKEGHGQAA